MNLMWEALLHGASCGIAKEEMRFVPAKSINPYREVSFKDVNRSVLSNEPVEVNALYRYAPVFEPLIDERLDEHDELRLVLFDILAHYLSELDLREGLSRSEYYSKFLSEDIVNGHYGKGNAAAAQHFSSVQSRYFLAEIRRQTDLPASNPSQAHRWRQTPCGCQRY